MSRTKPSVIVAVVFASLVRPQAQDNPQASSGSWRPTIVAQHGMVAAGHPLAAEAGMRILKAGGNAVDAAIATWAVQGEVEPGMTGLGADMFVLIYLAKTGEVDEDEHDGAEAGQDRKSTRLNSSHPPISYAVFCSKKKAARP